MRRESYGGSACRVNAARRSGLARRPSQPSPSEGLVASGGVGGYHEPSIMVPHRPTVFLLSACLAAGCSAAAPAGHLDTGLVRLPSGRVLQVEVADTPAEIRRGYMYREKISDDEGMVFFLGSLGFHSFWMKNCKVKLDIIWMDENWKIVHVEKNLPPCAKEPCPTYGPLEASLYVLEVRGGLAEKEGLRPGAHVVFVPPGTAPSHGGSQGDKHH